MLDAALFESIAEDMYLCGLARLRGLPVTALATSGYRHRQGATFGGNRAEEGLQRAVNRHRPGRPGEHGYRAAHSPACPADATLGLRVKWGSSTHLAHFRPP